MIFLALALVVALALQVAPALAGGGPSAGDSQYVDPLSNTHPAKQKHHTTKPSTQTSTSPQPTYTAPVYSTPTATTATTATVASATKKDPKNGKLPFTGINAWMLALVGIGLSGAGVTLRRTAAGG